MRVGAGTASAIHRVRQEHWSLVGMASVRIICPNGHLGFAPLEAGELRASASPPGPTSSRRTPAATTSAPIPLGSDTSTSPARLADARSRADAARLARARRADDHRLGGRHRHQQPRRPLRRRSSASSPRKHALPPFKLGYFYSEVDKEDCARRMRGGETVAGLDGHADAHRGGARRHRAHRRAWPACIRSSSCSSRAPT